MSNLSVSQLIEKILSSILTEGSDFKVTEQDENGFLIYNITAPSEEIGKIIGKEGRVINSIRCLARIKARKTNPKIIVKVVSETQNGNGLSLPTMTEDVSSGVTTKEE